MESSTVRIIADRDNIITRYFINCVRNSPEKFTTFTGGLQYGYDPAMFATVVNSLAIVVGTIAGLLIGRRLGASFRTVVFTAIGISTLIIGLSMALQSQRILLLVISLVAGGLIGTALRLEDRIFQLGELIKAKVLKSSAAPGNATFAEGFLVSSVLFCVGALAILGSFQAGVEGNYQLLYTKSVMDGSMAILLTAAYGVGVGFSALSVFLYQGALTLLSGLLAPYMTPLMISEISGVGGAMVIMIGLNLLELRTIKTADFLPALVLMITFVALEPLIISLF